MASAQATESPAQALGPAPSNGLLEWFWRGNALQTAKAAPKTSSLRRERLRRARLAAELADRTIDPAEPLRDGSAVPLAVSLFREAAYWSLLAKSELHTEGKPSLAELLDAGKYPKPALSDDDFALVRKALVDKSFVETAEDRADTQCRDADLLQAFVHGLVQSELDADDTVTSVLVQRWVRTGLLVLLVLGLLFAVVSSARKAMQGPDLLSGKPWVASSKAYECHPKDMECGGARSAMFFHTTEEDKPWVEFDLGSAQSFTRLEVVNREDCCPERAVPLIVEVSDDKAKWREIARRTDNFREWETTVAPTKARYVRLRVDRRTSFHLVRVSLRAN
jgi:hypothetical protein